MAKPYRALRISLCFLQTTLLPPLCVRCGRLGETLCEDCRALFSPASSYFCLCKVPTQLTSPGTCPRCAKLPLDGILAPFDARDKALISLARQVTEHPFVRELAGPFATLIVAYLQLTEHKLRVDKTTIMPLPLQRSLVKKQGFDHHQDLARALSRTIQVPYGVQASHVYLVGYTYEEELFVPYARLLREQGAHTVTVLTLMR